MVSIVSRVLFFASEIELGGVEYVLPNDIKARSEGSDGIEVGRANPDGEDSVFLSERLSASNGVVCGFADGFASEELE